MVTNVVISKSFLLGRTVFEKYENMGYKWDSDPRILNFVVKNPCRIFMYKWCKHVKAKTAHKSKTL